MNKSLKFITEFGPLVVFFAAYKTYDLIYATAALVIATGISVAVTYYVVRKIPMMPLIAALVVALFGGLTVFTGDGIFIKLKPTIVNVIFAAILLVGYAKNKGLLKYLFDSAMKMSDEAWKVFSMRWALFFLFLAVANEVVWRSFSEEIWVNFKIFGIMGVSFVFMATQIPFLNRNIIDNSSDEPSKE